MIWAERTLEKPDQSYDVYILFGQNEVYNEEYERLADLTQEGQSEYAGIQELIKDHFTGEGKP